MLFKHKKTFKDCIGVGGRKLRFDFYIPAINTLIEYDGKQHFYPIDYFGGEEAFSTLKTNDQIKNNYCNKNNITLVRIPYYHSKEKIIKQIHEIVFNIQESRNDHRAISDYGSYASGYYLTDGMV